MGIDGRRVFGRASSAIFAALSALATSCAPPGSTLYVWSPEPAPADTNWSLWPTAAATCASRGWQVFCVGTPLLTVRAEAPVSPQSRIHAEARWASWLAPRTRASFDGRPDVPAQIAGAFRLADGELHSWLYASRLSLRVRPTAAIVPVPGDRGICACVGDRCRCGVGDDRAVNIDSLRGFTELRRWNDMLCGLSAAPAFECHSIRRDPDGSLRAEEAVRYSVAGRPRSVAATSLGLCTTSPVGSTRCLDRALHEQSVDPMLTQRGAQLAANETEFCRLDEAGTVLCWPDANRVREARVRWRLPDGARGAVLRAGPQHHCVGFERGAQFEAWCWGDPTLGRLRSPSALPVARLSSIPLPAPAVRVDVGAVHSCAQLADGRIYCWGANFAGQCGALTEARHAAPFAGRLVSSVRPTLVATQPDRALQTGPARTCWCDAARCECVGARDDSSVPTGSDRVWSAPRSEPERRDDCDALQGLDGASWQQRACSADHACVLQSGVVRCIGANAWFQSAVVEDDRPSPVQTLVLPLQERP